MLRPWSPAAGGHDVWKSDPATYALAVDGERERARAFTQVDAIAPWLLDGLLALVVLVPTVAVASNGIHHASAAIGSHQVVKGFTFAQVPRNRQRAPSCRRWRCWCGAGGRFWSS